MRVRRAAAGVRGLRGLARERVAGRRSQAGEERTRRACSSAQRAAGAGARRPPQRTAGARRVACTRAYTATYYKGTDRSTQPADPGISRQKRR